MSPREVKVICTNRGQHPRTVLGRLERVPRMLADPERPGTHSVSESEYDWFIHSQNQQLRELQSWFDCPRCPREVKWRAETLQRIGAKLDLAPGVSDIDLSRMPATLT